MATPRTMPAPAAPSPSKHNPFARPRATENTAFSRASLLPVRSPTKPIDAGSSVAAAGRADREPLAPVNSTPTLAASVASPLPTPISCASSSTAPAKGPLPNPISSASVSGSTAVPAAAATAAPPTHLTPGPKAGTGTGSAAATPSLRRHAWRLLWRGGLEVGPDGWRLDGVTFIAHLAFNGTPSAKAFASPAAPTPPAAFGLPATDTDLCLSLESMRGRKYLQVRGVVPLTDDDIEVDDGGVQMSITSPLLAAFFTGLLCRSAKLSPQGRTTTGVVIGLGDEGVDPTASSMIIYGQRQDGSGSQPTPSLRLCVGRRRVAAPPSEKKVRPGEPLPRAPLLFPKAPKRPPPPIPRRSMSRAQSVSSIYAPPPSALPRSETLPALPAAGATGAPGRRGEKRPRTGAEVDGGDDERRRKSGRIVPDRVDVPAPTKPATSEPDEDIFGRRAASLAPPPRTSRPAAAGAADDGSSSSAVKKRAHQPQQLLDNKATIRKQTLLMLEARACPRDHAEFKDVFSLTTKGVYFALRHVLETRIEKSTVQELVGRHLDMYLQPQKARAEDESPPQKDVAPVEGDQGEDEEDGGCDPCADESMYADTNADADVSIRSDATETSVKVEHDVLRTPSPRPQRSGL